MIIQEGPSGNMRDADGPIRVFLPTGGAVEVSVVGDDLRIRTFVGGEQLVVRPSSTKAVWLAVEGVEGGLSRSSRDVARESHGEATEDNGEPHVADQVLEVLRRLERDR